MLVVIAHQWDIDLVVPEEATHIANLEFDEMPAPLACAHQTAYDCVGRESALELLRMTCTDRLTIEVEAIVLDFGGVVLDMRWDVARQLSRAHGLPPASIFETLYRTDT